MAVLSRPLPRLTRCGFSVCTFRPFPASVKSRRLFCRAEKSRQWPKPFPGHHHPQHSARQSSPCGWQGSAGGGREGGVAVGRPGGGVLAVCATQSNRITKQAN